MAEEVFSDIPEEMHATMVSDAEDSDSAFQESFRGRETDLNVVVCRSRSASALSTVRSENGVSFAKILSFAGSCSINLVLPFINGLMLGFGELVAHEISWDWNWFSRNNKGFRIFPESRKVEGANTMDESSATSEGRDKFL